VSRSKQTSWLIECLLWCRIWVSPLFPALLAPGGDSIGESATHFKRDLLEYLSVYRHSRVTEWLDIIRRYDLSAAK